MDMGTMEKTDMARVMTPIMTPPVCSVTQQQHCRNRGISGHTPSVCNHILQFISWTTNLFGYNA